MNCARRVAWERTRAVLKPVATNGSIGRREARALCMMFMQDGDGVRSVRKVASLRYRLRAPTLEPARSSSPMAGCTHLDELYATMPFGEVMDGGRGGNR